MSISSHVAGTMVLMKHAFNSKGSSRSRSSTGSSSLVESMDATTLINQMQGVRAHAVGDSGTDPSSQAMQGCHASAHTIFDC